MKEESRFKFLRKAVEKHNILNVNKFQLWEFLVGIVTILLLRDQNILIYNITRAILKKNTSKEYYLILILQI